MTWGSISVWHYLEAQRGRREAAVARASADRAPSTAPGNSVPADPQAASAAAAAGLDLVGRCRLTLLMKPPELQSLKLKCDMMLSRSAFKFNLRRYNLAEAGDVLSALGRSTERATAGGSLRIGRFRYIAWVKRPY